MVKITELQARGPNVSRDMCVYKAIHEEICQWQVGNMSLKKGSESHGGQSHYKWLWLNLSVQLNNPSSNWNNQGDSMSVVVWRNPIIVDVSY